ncbi:MAG: hypothetical protein HRU20_20135 [Pseudomonadales bacterium]|nr:hypothetical protein [Pseudomonadales bacterium]
MSLWGIGIGARLGFETSLISSISDQFSVNFVWDHCGDSGFLYTQEPEVESGWQLQAPVISAINIRLMTGHSLLKFGAARISNLNGWTIGDNIDVKCIADTQASMDISNSGLVVTTVGFGFTNSIGTAVGLHARKSWLKPLYISRKNDNSSYLKKSFNTFLPIPAASLSFIHAMKLLQSQNRLPLAHHV